MQKVQSQVLQKKAPNDVYDISGGMTSCTPGNAFLRACVQVKQGCAHVYSSLSGTRDFLSLKGRCP